MERIELSSVFRYGEQIPTKYSCDGNDVSPPLIWKNIPKSTKSLVIIAEDPDAPRGIWVHWIIYDLDPAIDHLPENAHKGNGLGKSTKSGMNDFKENNYGGPCPPSGKHRYFFRIFALDCELGLPDGKNKQEIEEAMDGHILAQGELLGVYSKM